MYQKSFDFNTSYLCIYAQGTNTAQNYNNYSNRVFEGANILLVGSPGSGKSVTTMAIAKDYYLDDCTIICLTNKDKSEYDNASCMFPPEKQYHLDLLKKHRIIAYNDEEGFKRMMKEYFFRRVSEKEICEQFQLFKKETQSVLSFFDDECKKQSQKKIRKPKILVGGVNGEELQDYEIEEKLLEKTFELFKKTKLDHYKNLVRIHTPFSFSLKNHLKKRKLLPKMEFFTIPIKSITTDCMSAIMSGSADKAYTRASIKILRGLNNDSTVYDFIWECSQQLSSFDTVGMAEVDEGSFIVQPAHAKIAGDARTAQSIKDNFDCFANDYFYAPNNAKTNINMLEIINDNKHIHFFNDSFLKDKRAKYSFYISILDLLMEALKSGEIKHHVLLVLEEVKILLPDDEEEYVRKLVGSLRKILSSVRSAGRGVTILATTQNYDETNKEFRSTCNEIIFGKVSIEDIRSFIRDFGFTAEKRRLLENLKTGIFVRMNDIQRGDLTPTMIMMPDYGIAESSDNFFDRYERHYPDLLTDYSDFYDIMELERDTAWGKVHKKFLDFKKKWKEMQDNKERKKWKKQEAKEKMEGLEAELKEKKEENKELLGQQVYEWNKNFHVSLAEAAKKVGIDRNKAVRYAVLYAKKIGDDVFVEENE